MKNIVLIFLVSVVGFAQKPVFATASINAVKVYSNSAEISESASVNLPRGTSEIVVKNVADNVNKNTIRVGAPASVTVLSVQFSNNYDSEMDENNPATKRLLDSIAFLKKEIKKIGIEKTSNTNSIEILDKNKQVFGQNSGLSVAELIKMIDFYKSKRTELEVSTINLDEKSSKLYKQLNELTSKLELNTKKEEKISKGKLIIQVMNEIVGNVDLSISYITNNASWKPFYDLRANSIAEPMDVMYKAEVIQNTGIDWKRVKLSLSSGNPNQNNEAPILKPWWLEYKVDEAMSIGTAADVLEEVVVMGYSRNNSGSDDDDFEKKETASKSKSIAKFTTIIESQLNVSFDIDIPYDILSNGKAHSVALKQLKMPVTYKYYAAPRVEKEAFLLAQVEGYSKFNLLKGDANIIFEDVYVGKTVINTSQTTDTLNLSIGRDKKISVEREKVVDKSGTKFLSTKKEQVFTYDITIRNNKKEAVELLLKDQYPLSPDKAIEIELLESNNAKINKETGILTWDLKISPAEIKKIRISYKIRYPKDRIIDNF